MAKMVGESEVKQIHVQRYFSVEFAPTTTSEAESQLPGQAVEVNAESDAGDRVRGRVDR